MEIKEVKLGADPELFLEKDGIIISAEGMIGGTKHEPKAISNKGHAIQEDNVMIEFNIPAADNRDSFVDDIVFVKDYLTQLVGLYDCKLNISASAELDKKQLTTAQAKLFGCEPDLNVYTKSVNDPPEPTGTLRTCGGHIHIGFLNPSFATSELIVLAMDQVLGLESIILDPDVRRREMYGNAGAFRVKSYGVEYRSLSNFWIKDEESIKWAYDKTQEAVELVRSGLVSKIHEKLGNEIRSAIDNNNKEKAKELIIKIETIKAVCVE